MADAVGITITCLEKAYKLWKYGMAVQDASKDVNRLSNELGYLVKVLEALQTADLSSNVRSLIDSPLGECHQALESLSGNLPMRSGIKGKIDRLKWPLKEDETKKHIDKFERFKGLFTLALIVDNVALMRKSEPQIAEILSTIQTIKEEREEQKENESSRRSDRKRSKVLEWLSPENFDGKHIDIGTRRAATTGRWIQEAPELRKWISGEQCSRVLWGKGAPGAGKTFLCYSVIDHLLALSQNKNYGVAYFYFTYSDEDQQKLVNVLASLVMQLLAQISQLPESVERLYKDCKKKGTRPEIRQLEAAIFDTSNAFTELFFVFDALDEYNEEGRADLLSSLERMWNHGINIFIISRPHLEDLNEALSGAAEFQLSAHREDLEIFIKKTMDSKKRAKHLFQDPSCRDRVISVLTQYANGMFQLVYLLLDELCDQISVNDMLQALSDFEHSTARRTYDVIYDQTIKRLHDQPRPSTELALRILVWLAKARRPFTVKELREAVSVKPNKYTLTENDLPPHVLLIDVCGGLVTINQTDNTVHLVHSTVQEYILDRPDLLPQDPDFVILEACTTYLSFDVFRQGPCTTTEEFYTRMRQRPFLCYVGRYWGSIVQSCSKTLSTQVIYTFLKNPGSISSYLQIEHFHIYGDADAYPTGRFALHIACKIGHSAVVERILAENEPPWTVRDSTDMTPLHFAVSMQSEEIVRLLLEKETTFFGSETSRDDGRQNTTSETSVSDAIQGPWTPLHSAVLTENYDMVRLLSERGVFISAQTYNGTTPLHTAVSARNEAIVRCLLESGADVSIQDAHGATPMHMAEFEGNVQITNFLLERVTDEVVSVQDRYGVTPLHNAVKAGNAAVVQTLLKKGAAVSTQDEKGVTPLHLAVFTGNKTILLLLIVKHAAVSIQDNHGWTPLHIAVFSGNEWVVWLLLESYSADVVSLQDAAGWTPLHIAAFILNEALVWLLLEKGAKVSVRNKNGQTALHLAASGGNAVIVQLLLDKGAGALAQDEDGDTPFHGAIRADSETVVCLLLESVATAVSVQGKNGWTPLHHAAWGGNESIVRMLVEKGANVSTQSTDGVTPLHLAVYMRDRAITLFLLERGANVSAQDSSGAMALHVAASDGNADVVRLLLEEGADVSMQDEDRSTALHEAAYEGHAEVVRLLLENGAIVSMQRENGATALHVAASRGDEEVVRLLLEKGADVSIQNNDGDTPLDVAGPQSRGFSSNSLAPKCRSSTARILWPRWRPRPGADMRTRVIK